MLRSSLTFRINCLQKFFEKIGEDEKTVSAYVHECFQICWLMSIQDPPVVLGSQPQSGSRFDTSLYKAYTSSGTTLEFLVWPAMFLYEGGNILSKGVAQGRK